MTDSWLWMLGLPVVQNLAIAVILGKLAERKRRRFLPWALAGLAGALLPPLGLMWLLSSPAPAEDSFAMLGALSGLSWLLFLAPWVGLAAASFLCPKCGAKMGGVRFGVCEHCGTLVEKASSKRMPKASEPLG